MRLLNIEASPRRAASVSIAVAAAFVDAFRDAHPCVDVDTMNVWDEHLPDFDSEAIGAKYKAVSRQPMSAPERAVWERIQSLAERFREADFIVLGVPMWNFAYPYKLKHLTTLPVSGICYSPLTARRTGRRSKRGALSSSTFGDRATRPVSPPPPLPGSSIRRYIEFWLKFIGVSDVTSLTVEPTGRKMSRLRATRRSSRTRPSALRHHTSPRQQRMRDHRARRHRRCGMPRLLRAARPPNHHSDE